MDEEVRKRVDELHAALDEINAYDAHQLAIGTGLGDINFESGEDTFRQAIDLSTELRALPVELLSKNVLNGFPAPAVALREALKNVSQFSLKGVQNPEGTRDQLLSAATSAYDTAFAAWTTWTPYLSLKSADVQATMSQAADLLRKLKEEVSGTKTELDGKKLQLDEIIAAARDAAATVGVAHFAEDFNAVAEQHKTGAKYWLWAAAGLGITTVVTALLMLWFLPPNGSDLDPGNLQRIVTKVVVVSILYFSAIWAGKNFKAHRHLAVVNLHRQSALKTFETFVQAAGDEATRNAVLLEATRCIFTPSATGYLNSEPEAGGGSRVVEHLKTFAPRPGE